MKQRTFFNIFLSVFTLPLVAFADGVDCGVAQSAIIQASAIRGLKIQHQVPCTIDNREQVKQFLLNAVQNRIPAEKMRCDELVAKALGFIPEDFDYKSGLVNLYLSQLGGYYDPEKKKYVMAGWLPQLMQPTVAVHELTHALQDQHFNLQAFIDDQHFSTDKLLARAALVEGDATAVMLDYQRDLIGQVPLAEVEKVDSIVMQTVLGMEFSTVANPPPPALKAALLFPYASGIRFVHHLLRNGGYRRVSQAFQSPPNTSKEILEPEKYLARSAVYREVSDSDFAPELGQLQISYRDSLGQFSIGALLSGETSQAESAFKAASGWAGDGVILAGERGKEMLIWKIFWESENDAKEFFSAYRHFLAARGSAVTLEPSENVAITVDNREVTIERKGLSVVVRSTVKVADVKK